jgi:hypothetical protein
MGKQTRAQMAGDCLERAAALGQQMNRRDDLEVIRRGMHFQVINWDCGLKAFSFQP